MATRAAVERPERDGTVSQAVVTAVAEVTGSDPTSLDPLYHTIDPEALDDLFDTDQPEFDGSPDRVEFTYSGCDVVVTRDGTVRVTDSGHGAPR